MKGRRRELPDMFHERDWATFTQDTARMHPQAGARVPQIAYTVPARALQRRTYRRDLRRLERAEGVP